MLLFDRYFQMADSLLSGMPLERRPKASHKFGSRVEASRSGRSTQKNSEVLARNFIQFDFVDCLTDCLTSKTMLNIV